MPSSRPVLRSQARKMIYEVYRFMKKEVKKEKDAVKRTSDAVGTSERTVRRIVKESKDSLLNPVFRTPGRRRLKKKMVIDIDPLDHSTIRKCIYNYHITNKEMPTLKMLTKKLKELINFNGSVHSLRRLLDKIGFQRKITGNFRRLIIEKHNIRLLRIEFLKNIIRYRQEGRPIIYTAASFIDSSNIGTKMWPDESSKWLRKPISKYQRIVMVHAGSKAGFVPNALLLFETETKPGDFHNAINYDTYNKWLRTQLIPNLPPNSVLVIDNSSYHMKQYDPAPSSDAKREDMHWWLEEKGIPYDEDMLKPQLYNLIRSYKEQQKKYSIDELLAEHNHSVLRLPPYHPELNLLEVAWPVIKQYVAGKKAINADQVKKVIIEKTSYMNVNEWSKFYKKVENIEAEYIKSDRLIDMLTERLTIGDSNPSDSSSEEIDQSDETDDCEDSDEIYEDEKEPTSSTSSTTVTKVEYLTPEVLLKSDSDDDDDGVILIVNE